VLIVVSGLPATGKTTICRELARRAGGVHLRIDTIEQAVVDSGIASHPLGPVGYDVAYALAGDYLRQGLVVLADSVNPVSATREAWRDVAARAGVGSLDVEIYCSDQAEHRRRAETRVVDIAGLPSPTWAQIQDREYEAWGAGCIRVDTAGRPIDECVDELEGLLDGQGIARRR